VFSTSTGSQSDGLTFVAAPLDFSRTAFSPANTWSGRLYGPFAADPGGNIYIAGNLNAYPFTPFNSIISIITPGNALPTQSLNVPLPSGSYGISGVYVDKSGSIYSWGILPNFIDVFPANSRDAAQPSRTIDGSAWPFTIDRIVTDSTGRIYILTHSGSGGTDGLAILPANATGSAQAQVVPSLTLASTALAADSHDRIYAIDGTVASQVDVGAADQSGNFRLVGSLSDQRICCPGLLLVDANDNLFMSGYNELDAFPFGSFGSAAPSIVDVIPPQRDVWEDAVLLPENAPLPSPPPSSYITLSPDSISLSMSASPTAPFTAFEPGYSGKFQIGSSSCLTENADPHTYAQVSPQSGTTFTVSAPTGDLPGYCGISIDDSLGHRASLTVQVSN
jgi:hypothetical protein